MENIEEAFTETASPVCGAQLHELRISGRIITPLTVIDQGEEVIHHLACLCEKCGQTERLDMETEFLTLKDVADYLGVSTGTVRGMISAREIRAVKVGKVFKIKRNDLEVWERRSETMPPNDD